MWYRPSKSEERDLSCFNQSLKKQQAKHCRMALASEQSPRGGFLPGARLTGRCGKLECGAAGREHIRPSSSSDVKRFSSCPQQWPRSPGTYPSASSIGSGGGSRDADGMTVLVPRETRSCSVFVDREATAMGCSRVVAMPVVTVRLWPEPLRVRSGVGRSGLRMLTRQKAEPLLGMKFTLFLSGQ